MSSDSLWLTLTTKPQVHSEMKKNSVHESSYLTDSNQFWCAGFVQIGLVMRWCLTLAEKYGIVHCPYKGTGWSHDPLTNHKRISDLIRTDEKLTLRGTDLWLGYLNSNKFFYLSWSNFNFSDFGKMELPIWQRWFCCVGSSCITEAMHWSPTTVILGTEWKNGYSEKLESVPLLFAKLSWNFLSHKAAAVTVLETDNISPVCRYMIEIWPVMTTGN